MSLNLNCKAKRGCRNKTNNLKTIRVLLFISNILKGHKYVALL